MQGREINQAYNHIALQRQQEFTCQHQEDDMKLEKRSAECTLIGTWLLAQAMNVIFVVE